MWRELLGDQQWKATVSLAVILGAVYFFVHVATSSSHPPPLDKYGCLIGQNVPASVIILADNTDPYSQSQIVEFQSIVDQTLENTQTWGMVSLGTIRDLPIKPLIRACRPPHVTEGSVSDIWNHPAQSWLQIEANYEQTFADPLEQQASQMPLNATAPFSPILQTIQDSMSSLGTYWHDAKSRRIIIFSDMMENTLNYSQYSRQLADVGFQSSLPRAKYMFAPLDIQNTDIVIYYLTGLAHDRPYQGDAHEKFWTTLFAASGARVEFIDLPMDSSDVAQQ